jgi:predicted aconitase with swiveling domain
MSTNESVTMESKIIKCRKISKGYAEGEVILTKDPLSFLGGVNPDNGVVIDSKHELYGRNMTGKVLVIPSGKGSTVGSYVLFQMAKNKTAPRAIVAIEAEPIIATGAIMAGIPMVDRPEAKILNILHNGDQVVVDADSGFLKILS